MKKTLFYAEQPHSFYNMYYLDYLFFMRSYTVLSELKDDVSIIVLILNLAVSSLSFNLPITAYGLFRKCLSLNPQMPEVNQMCKDGIHNIVKCGKINNIIDKIITQYLNDDLFELMWILDDLDRLTPQNTLEKILG